MRSLQLERQQSLLIKKRTGPIGFFRLLSEEADVLGYYYVTWLVAARREKCNCSVIKLYSLSVSVNVHLHISGFFI